MKITRRTKLLIVALALCFTAMIGSTFAWFTDSVESTSNVIQAGNLNVELYYKSNDMSDYAKVGESTNVFKENTHWEPGHTEVVKFKVVNEGNLALKYRLSTNVISETDSTNVKGDNFNLSDYIKCGILVTDSEQNYSREAAIAAVEETATTLKADYLSGATSLDPTETDYVTMVVFMPASIGNEANHATGAAVPQITLGIKLEATQQVSEHDSFGNTYDSEADFPSDANVLQSGNVVVNIPDNAPAGHYALNVTKNGTNVAEDGKVTLSYDISLTRNGQAVKKADGIKYPVTLDLEPVLDIKTLLHNGTAISDYEYDPLDTEGLLTFETNSFSPFTIDYYVMGTAVKIEKHKLTAGMFTNYDPRNIDETLKGNDSEYLAIEYTKDRYAVSKRSTTVFLAPSDCEQPEDSYYTVKVNSSGKLWSEISALQNNAHSTVYLLPGTYNEGTTIYVYSSMDIIGLGDKDSVKVVKTSSSSKNRHLFNCNGTKADYIEVTLRNLYLDATAKTDNSKDNAAVQSIRKSKVKCYDLTIVKGTGWDSFAFYVNGNNALDGVKYPAYLYAENCSLNTTRTSGIVTTSGSYKFYHSGLTYNNGTTYTQNSGSIKNMKMELDDWDWEN